MPSSSYVWSLTAVFLFAMWPLMLVYALSNSRGNWRYMLAIWFLLLLARIWVFVSSQEMRKSLQILLAFYLPDPWNTLLFGIVGAFLFFMAVIRKHSFS